jgi:hypothetical protein
MTLIGLRHFRVVLIFPVVGPVIAFGELHPVQVLQGLHRDIRLQVDGKGFQVFAVMKIDGDTN